MNESATSKASASANAPLSGRRLVIVSNRLPFNVEIKDGRPIFHASAGGLVTGLASFRESRSPSTALPVQPIPTMRRRPIASRRNSRPRTFLSNDVPPPVISTGGGFVFAPLET